MSELDDEKLFYERFWALHRDAQLVEVVKEFGISLFRRSSVLEGFDEFIKANNFSGKRCVEIGSCKGLTAVILARYFDEIISIDIQPDPDKAALARFCGVRDKIQFFDIKNNEEKANLVRCYRFDGAYVDADHKRDTEFDFALVKDCGRVLFHEYWESQPAVMALVDRLRKSGDVVTQGKFALWTK